MTQHDTDRTYDMTRQDSGTATSGQVTVEEAARLLDVSVDAIRKRIERGTLRSAKVGKTRYVLLDDVMSRPDVDRTRQDSGNDTNMTSQDNDMTSLLTSMQDQIDTLKRELEDRKEEARRKDAILMTMAQRIPELEAASEPRESPVTASKNEEKDGGPDQEKPPQRRSWWRAFFGLE
jgi:excisionase family DNA binding protein